MKNLLTIPALFLAATSAHAEALLSVDRAVELSKQTGRPILAVAGRTNCPACRRIASQLEKDPAARRVASVYVLLKMDVGDRKEFPKWNRKHRFKGGAIPAMWVVRADGTELYVGGGAPRNLVQFLLSHLPKVGKLLPPAQLARLSKAATQIDALARQKEYAELAPLLSRYAGSGSFAAAAQAIDKTAANLVKQAEQELKTALDRLKDEGTAEQGAVALLSVRDRFGKLPRVGRTIANAVRKASRDPQIKPLLLKAAQKSK